MKTTKQEKLDIIKWVLKKIKNEDLLNINEVEESLAYVFDDNYYGNLEQFKLCKCKVGIESIWTDSAYHIMMHVAEDEFEGDIQLFSLPNKQIVKIIKSIKKYIENY